MTSTLIMTSASGGEYLAVQLSELAPDLGLRQKRSLVSQGVVVR